MRIFQKGAAGLFLIFFIFIFIFWIATLGIDEVEDEEKEEEWAIGVARFIRSFWQESAASG